MFYKNILYFRKITSMFNCLKKFLPFIYPNAMSSSIIAWLFSITGPLFIVLQSAQSGHLSPSSTISWIFSIHFIGGLLTLLLSIYYKQPIAIAYTIPGAILVSDSLANHSLEEVIGAYVVTSVAVLLLGTIGLIDKVNSFFPMPIIMGMVSGVLLPFPKDLIISLVEDPYLTVLPFLTFLVLSFFNQIAKLCPPVLGATIMGGILLYVFDLYPHGLSPIQVSTPEFFFPSFNLKTISELVVPLLITVTAVQNSQGIGILKSNGYHPPVKALTIWSGIGSLANSFFGAHSACVAGPMTAILTGSTSDSRQKYVSAIILGVLWMIVGLFAPTAIWISQFIPTSLIKMLSGIVIIPVLIQSLQLSFSTNFKIGAFFSFLITISDFSFFQIGSAFWGLLGGILFSFFMERSDFKSLKPASENPVLKATQ